MLFIISPAKKMVDAADSFAWCDMPRFLPQTCELLEAMRTLSYDEAKALWKCSDALAELNYERVQSMDPACAAACTPAAFSYEGIQYQNMAPQVMTQGQLDYLQRHLRILSGFYGVLRPFDAVVPYRLEMQAKLAVGGARATCTAIGVRACTRRWRMILRSRDVGSGRRTGAVRPRPIATRTKAARRMALRPIPVASSLMRRVPLVCPRPKSPSS